MRLKYSQTTVHPTGEIKEIHSYKQKLQAFMIFFEHKGNIDMLEKLKAADSLLDNRLRQLI